MKNTKLNMILLFMISISVSIFSCNKEVKTEEVNPHATQQVKKEKKVVKTIKVKKKPIKKTVERQVDIVKEKIVEQPTGETHGRASQQVEKSKDDGKIIIITGKLGRTKGARAYLSGKILDNDFITEKSSKKWKPKYEKMYGKTVEAKGRLKVNYCDPRAQCLMGGKIEFLQEIEYLKLKK